LGFQEGSVVLFKGGWCDLAYWSGSPSDDPVIEAPMTSPSMATCSTASSTLAINHGLADNLMHHCRFGSPVSRSAVSGMTVRIDVRISNRVRVSGVRLRGVDGQALRDLAAA
jgi:hypothetical protein